MIRRPYLLAGALATGLASATALRFSLVPAVLVVGAALFRPRLGLACALALAGWWWGSERLLALDRSVLAPRIGTAGSAIVELQEPPRHGRYEVRVRASVVRWSRALVREPVLLELPGRRAPPQGARLRVLGTLRSPRDFERTWLHRHGVHVVLRASTWRVIRLRGGLADRLHAWLTRASTPGLAGERRAVLHGVVLGEDSGLSDTLRQRFRASGLYHLLAVSGGNVVVVAGGTVALALLLGVSRLVAEVAAIALLAWNPYNVLDPGFQLSFAAVLSIFVLAPRFRRALEGYPVPRPAAECIAISAACGLCTAPISWLHFHAIPVLTVPANAAAAPVVAPMLALALLAAILPPVGPALAQLNGWCAAYLAGCARFFGGLPGAQARSPAAVAALASGVLLAAAYAWQRGERAQAGLSPHRQRPAEDHPRRAPLA